MFFRPGGRKVGGKKFPSGGIAKGSRRILGGEAPSGRGGLKRLLPAPYLLLTVGKGVGEGGKSRGLQMGPSLGQFGPGSVEGL